MTSIALNKVFVLSDNHTITTIDCGASMGSASYQGITSLNCTSSLPTSALTSVKITSSILDIAEPLVPALSAHFIPAVTGVLVI